MSTSLPASITVHVDYSGRVQHAWGAAYQKPGQPVTVLGGLLKKDTQKNWNGETQAYLACLAALSKSTDPWEIRSDFDTTCKTYNLQKATGKEVLHRRAHKEANAQRLRAEQAKVVPAAPAAKPAPVVKAAPVIRPAPVVKPGPTPQQQRLSEAKARLEHLNTLGAALEKALADIARERAVLHGVIQRDGLSVKEKKVGMRAGESMQDRQMDDDQDDLVQILLQLEGAPREEGGAVGPPADGIQAG